MGVRTLALLVFLANCSPARKSGESDDGVGGWAAQVAWMHGACAVSRSALEPGAQLTVIVLSAPQRVLESRILGPAETGADCWPLLGDRKRVNAEPDRHFLRTTVPEGDSIGMAIALSQRQPAVRISDGMAKVDVDGDGREEIFGTCSTAEGVRFYARDAETGELRWSDYYYLGYDAKPNCPEDVSAP